MMKEESRGYDINNRRLNSRKKVFLIKDTIHNQGYNCHKYSYTK